MTDKPRTRDLKKPGQPAPTAEPRTRTTAKKEEKMIDKKKRPTRAELDKTVKEAIIEADAREAADIQAAKDLARTIAASFDRKPYAAVAFKLTFNEATQPAAICRRMEAPDVVAADFVAVMTRMKRNPAARDLLKKTCDLIIQELDEADAKDAAKKKTA